MTYVIIHALAPIFVIMLLGFWAGKAKMVDNKNVSLLNIFVMDFALPATLFSATVQTPWSGIVAQSPLVLVLTGAMWITYAAIYFLATRVFKRSPQDAAVLTLTVALPNYAALGLPILGSVLGEGALQGQDAYTHHQPRPANCSALSKERTAMPDMASPRFSLIRANVPGSS